MKTCVASIMLSLFCLTLFIQNTESAPRCTTHDQPQPNPEKCEFGVALDWCRNEKCALGPGASCGDQYYELGQCGEGTFCSCGTCTGCSLITLACHESKLTC